MEELIAKQEFEGAKEDIQKNIKGSLKLFWVLMTLAVITEVIVKWVKN